jgi:hypothetical protein
MNVWGAATRERCQAAIADDEQLCDGVFQLAANRRFWGMSSWGIASWGMASWGIASWGIASWGIASWGMATRERWQAAIADGECRCDGGFQLAANPPVLGYGDPRAVSGRASREHGSIVMISSPRLLRARLGCGDPRAV